MVHLAGCLIDGVFVRMDRDEAFGWLSKAAALGSVLAMEGLAMCYRKGWGVPISETVAREWAEKAAIRGRPGE